MISLTKNYFARFVLAVSPGAVCASAAGVAHAGSLYEISVYEDAFGPAGSIPYQNGIIQKCTTNPDGPTNASQAAGFQYSDAHNEINGIAGGYKVTAEASNAHGGTTHAYAFGDGGFSGYSTSVDGQGISYPQQGYTYASSYLIYNFRLVGPSSTTPVPVTFDATAYVKTVGTGFGFRQRPSISTYTSSGRPAIANCSWLTRKSPGSEASGAPPRLPPRSQDGVLGGKRRRGRSQRRHCRRQRREACGRRVFSASDPTG